MANSRCAELTTRLAVKTTATVMATLPANAPIYSLSNAKSVDKAAVNTEDQHRVRLERRERDAKFEDELFHCGFFADVVFKFPGVAEVEEVYGQTSLFALCSPPLRALMMGSDAAREGNARLVETTLPRSGLVDRTKSGDCRGNSIEAGYRTLGGAAATTSWNGEHATGRLEISMDGIASVAGFREVARYVYGIPQRFSTATLPDVIQAAHRFELVELEEAAFAWGLDVLAGGTDLVAERASELIPPSSQETLVSQTGVNGGGADDALRCLDMLCSLEPREVNWDFASKWQEALGRAYTAQDMFDSSAFLEISLACLQELLKNEAVHRDPGSLWRACVAWAEERAGCDGLLPVQPLQSTGASVVARPYRLLGRGAKLAVPQRPPPSEALEWQRCLIPAAEKIQFARLTPAEFAKQVEALDPMLVDLRQAVYASRRRALRPGSGEEGDGRHDD
eukprot:TRINITY_DN54701_c0_g1_i1.p1 TRINITY_DN54701_c0_g1~~TRINITY_DN54701_c0_g1_i1.p1  ORF type:complete len:452 (-),score=63.50 TRINITY_DN54701_c0_g1_i1:1058-2413(-)